MYSFRSGESKPNENCTFPRSATTQPAQEKSKVVFTGLRLKSEGHIKTENYDKDQFISLLVLFCKKKLPIKIALDSS